MTIDTYNLVPKTARSFPAIGGGYGVKMRIVGGLEEMLFGQYDDRTFAALVCAEANQLTDFSKPTTVDAIEAGVVRRVQEIAARVA